MAHLPGHRFIGPGTQDLTAQPLDRDDEIAQHHDISYQLAESEADVRAADREAIRDFVSDWQNPHSIVGAVGLGAKYAVESVVGVRYPSREYAATVCSL